MRAPALVRRLAAQGIHWPGGPDNAAFHFPRNLPWLWYLVPLDGRKDYPTIGSFFRPRQLVSGFIVIRHALSASVELEPVARQAADRQRGFFRPCRRPKWSCLRRGPN